MIAQSLLAVAAALDMKAFFHVVVLAGSYEEFQSGLSRVIQYARDFLGVPLNSLPDYRKYDSATARSFGSANKTVFKEIQRIAREAGILTDPVYSAKLFLTARQTIRDQALKGNILLVHSGGGLTLTGFMDHPMFSV
jgi:1-aminocyclopropane-1-carboxylate deaminase/D-cysteine desulfhydrase-like pyridoxal-dependent ACC family enzyme